MLLACFRTTVSDVRACARGVAGMWSSDGKRARRRRRTALASADPSSGREGKESCRSQSRAQDFPSRAEFVPVPSALFLLVLRGVYFWVRKCVRRPVAQQKSAVFTNFLTHKSTLLSISNNLKANNSKFDIKLQNKTSLLAAL